MKIQITDAPLAPNVPRRKPPLGLPDGLALATPLALLGCGGSSDESASGDGTGASGTSGDGIGFGGPIGESTCAVTITLPA